MNVFSECSLSYVKIVQMSEKTAISYQQQMINNMGAGWHEGVGGDSKHLSSYDEYS